MIASQSGHDYTPPDDIYSAVDGYFQAFLQAVNHGGGVPDPQLIRTAQKTLESESSLNDVEYGVWVSMDAVMGWDFMYPNKLQRTSGYVGNIREVHGVSAALGIVDAARRGLLDALKSGDSKKVAEPLQEFWSKNPKFSPRHLGRCYPHGHEEVTDDRSTAACQIDTLQQVAIMLIKTAKVNSSKNISSNQGSLGTELPAERWGASAKCIRSCASGGDLQ